jgi:dihydrofolate synthase / folylpolyglutamate synthase
MSFRTYHDALAFWFARVNYEQRSPRPSDLKLDRMRALLRLLGEPQERLRVVHIAGSKGKGSTAAMLASVLRHAGYRTGLFTSPHLSRVEERIQVDGEPISADELTSVLGDVADAVRKLDLAAAPAFVDVASWANRGRAQAPEPPAPVTFFEVGTAAGFLHFLRRRVDVAVVEVGLGGRFDSTNVCQPLVALITSISLDHVQQLGDRLASIAMEKAGIVKPGRPAVSGATALEAREVIEQICRERHAPLRQLGVDFRYSYEPGKVTAEGTRPARVQVFTDRRAWPLLELGLLGEHQAANAAVAVTCLEHLRAAGWAITDRAVADGLARVSWPARLEVLQRRPLVVLDCAHNAASAQALVEALRQSFPPVRRLLIFAVSSDKDVAAMFRILGPHFRHVFLTRYNSTRSVPPDDLAALLRQTTDLPHTVCPTAAEAWQAARVLAGPKDLVCVAGSVFLAGEMRPLLLEGA